MCPKFGPEVAEQAGMGISLFERLAVSYSHNGISSPVSLLAQQYRMHPAISHFSREHFYGGRVKDHPSVLERISCVLSHQGLGARVSLDVPDFGNRTVTYRDQARDSGILFIHLKPPYHTRPATRCRRGMSIIPPGPWQVESVHSWCGRDRVQGRSCNLENLL